MELRKAGREKGNTAENPAASTEIAGDSRVGWIIFVGELLELRRVVECCLVRATDLAQRTNATSVLFGRTERTMTCLNEIFFSSAECSR